MKGHKLFSLDIDIIEDLKTVGNASGMVNDLLKEWFCESGVLKKAAYEAKLNKKTIELTNINTEIEQIKEKIAEIEVYDKRIKAIFKDIPAEILNDFKEFPNMTEKILINRYQNVYRRQYKITLKEIQEAYRKFYEE